VRRALLAALVASLAAAPAARADQTITAAPPNQYVNPTVTIDQGEKVTFQNLDTVDHDVTAKAKGTDGQPLFHSALVGTGGSSDVAGTEYLTSGSYEYFCSIHSFMQGTIEVTTAGAPKPRPGPKPGSGGGGGGGSGPTVGIRVLDTSLKAVRRRGSLHVRVKAREPATVRLTARGEKTKLASATIRFKKARTARLYMKLTRAGAKLVRERDKLRVTLTSRATSSGRSATSRGSWSLSD
jgi:plastocyanin